jgi:hypothetical protein
MAVLSLIAAVCLSGGPQKVNLQVENLRNLKGVRVLVEDLREDIKNNEITKDDVQTEVELTLRTYGIPVTTEPNSPVFPTLYVNLNTITQTVGSERRPVGYAGSVSIHLYYLERPRNNLLTGFAEVTLWYVGGVIAVRLGDLKQFSLETVNTYIKKFANDWLAANPKN